MARETVVISYERTAEGLRDIAVVLDAGRDLLVVLEDLRCIIDGYEQAFLDGALARVHYPET